MPIKPVKVGTAGALGLAHVGTLYLDEVQGWEEPFKRASDYPSLIGFGFGLITEGMDVFTEGSPEEEAADALLCASEPLLIRSIYEGLRYYLAPEAPVPREGGGGQGQGKWKLIKRGRKPGKAQRATIRYV